MVDPDAIVVAPPRELSTDVAEERAEVDALESSPFSDGTRAAYRSDLKVFGAWCAARGLRPVPCDLETLKQFVAAMVRGTTGAEDPGRKRAGRAPAAGARRPCGIRLIRRRIAAIAAFHDLAKPAQPSPHREPAFRAYMKTVARKVGRPPVKKTGIDVPTLRRMVAALPPGPTLARDRALLLLWFAGAFRRVEASSLRAEWLAFEPEGVRITLPHSKGDQEGRGQTVDVPRARDPELCGVAALEALLAGRTRGPAFRPLAWRSTGEPLKPGSAALVVKKALARVGIDPAKYGGHSMRRGFVTAAVRAGATLPSVMKKTRHKHLGTLQEYVEESPAWEDDAGRRVL